jgi:hypothetical protein
MAGILLILGVSASLWALILLGGLPSRIAWYSFPLAVPAVALIVLVWTTVVLVRRREISRRQVATAVVALVALYPVAWIPADFPFAYPVSEGRVRPGLTVRVPLDGPVRVLYGGNRKAENYHAVFPDQRWAFDLAIDPNPDELATPGLPFTEYGCWGAPVLAPANGHVTAAHDGEPDNTPGTSWRARLDPAGNYVDIEVASTRTHLLVAHLKQGSVRVTTGQPALEGDTLGACGSSGNSTLPHVHIHHQREPWAHAAVWRLAEGLPLRFRDYRGDEEPRGGGSEDATGYWRWTGSVLEHVGR